MLSKTLQDAISTQIKQELESAYLYLGMAAHFDAVNLPGFAKWMRKQFGEEQGHALKFYEYVYDRGGRVVLQAIAAPPAEFGKPVEVFQQVLGHEQKVTAWIKDLYDLALKENDQATQVFLQWFISEQVEEEKHATELIEQLKMAGDQPFSLLFMDKHVLGERK